MAIPLNIRIRCVIEMARFGSPVQVRRELQHENAIEIPSDHHIRDIYSKFCRHGTVHDLPRSGRPTIVDEQLVEQVSEKVHEDQPSSSRAIAEEVGVHQQIVLKILHCYLDAKPYILQTHQLLIAEDKEIRVEAAKSILPFLSLPDLIFSDECEFSLHGHVCKHNCRIWATEKPNTVHEVPIQGPKIMVWAAMSSRQIFGPYFFTATIDGLVYLKMLKEFFYPLCQKRRITQTLVFQHDGASPHFANVVKEWLNKKFPSRWIGRGSSVPWPPRSPDLNPLDFSLWHYIKERVYNTPVANLDELRLRIENAMSSITPELLGRIFENVAFRMNKVIDVEGEHIEQLI